MPTITSDLRLLKAAVLAAPDDAAPKLALADCAEEGGDAALAAGLRWCVANGKWPQDEMDTQYRSWAWYDDHESPELAAGRFYLPNRLWERVEKTTPASTLKRYIFRGCEAVDPFVIVRRLGKVLLGADRV